MIRLLIEKNIIFLNLYTHNQHIFSVKYSCLTFLISLSTIFINKYSWKLNMICNLFLKYTIKLHVMCFIRIFIESVDRWNNINRDNSFLRVLWKRRHFSSMISNARTMVSHTCRIYILSRTETTAIIAHARNHDDEKMHRMILY